MTDDLISKAELNQVLGGFRHGQPPTPGPSYLPRISATTLFNKPEFYRTGTTT